MKKVLVNGKEAASTNDVVKESQYVVVKNWKGSTTKISVSYQ